MSVKSAPADGKWYQSEVKSLTTALVGESVNPAFLSPALCWDEPVIDRIVLDVTAPVTTQNVGGAGARASLFWQLFPLITFIGGDSALPRFNNRGAHLRLLNQYIYGRDFEDGPSLGQNFNATVRVELPLPVENKREVDGTGHSTRWPLRPFFSGSQILLSSIVPGAVGSVAGNQLTLGAGGTVQVRAHVIDEKTKDSKARMICFEKQWDQIPQKFFQFNGAMDAFLLYNGAANENTLTPFAALTLSSDYMDMRSVPSYLLRDDYMRNLQIRQADPSGAVFVEDAVANGNVIPVKYSDRKKSFHEKIDVLDQFDIVTDLTPLPAGSFGIFYGYDLKAIGGPSSCGTAETIGSVFTDADPETFIKSADGAVVKITPENQRIARMLPTVAASYAPASSAIGK